MYEFYNGLLSDFISDHRKFHSWDLFAEVWEVRWRGTFYPVADLGEKPRGAPAPPPFLGQAEARRAEKIFLETGYPPCLRVWMIPPPHLSEYLLSLSKPKTTTYGLNSFSYFSAKQ